MREKILVCILALFGILNIPSISLSQDGLEKGITELSQQIASKVSQQHKTTIAVIEFSDLRGSVTDFGRFLAEELITRLYSTQKFKVIERQLLNRVISEQKLNLSGMVDPKSAKELGKLLGVDAIVSGTITDLVKTLRVNARLISTQTGEIFAVASSEIAKDESVKELIGSGSRPVRDEAIKGTSPSSSEIPQLGLLVEDKEYQFELLSCKVSGKEVLCSFAVTNKGKDRNLFVGGARGKIIDDGGNEYVGTEVRIANKTGKTVQTLLVSGVRTKAAIKFGPLQTAPLSLSLIEIDCHSEAEWFVIQFRNVPIAK